MDAKLSLQVFGLYLIVVAGLGLMIVPHTLLGLFGLEAGDDAWIRMVGLLAALIGVYYMLAARAGIEELFRWSIPVRAVAAAFMVGLFVTDRLGPGILLFAFLDAAGATWTWAALRAGASRPAK